MLVKPALVSIIGGPATAPTVVWARQFMTHKTIFSPALVTARHWRRLSCYCILPAVYRNVLNAVLNPLARRLNPRPTGCPCHTRPTANPLGVATHAEIAHRRYRRSLHPASMVADRAGCGRGGRFQVLRRNAIFHPNQNPNRYLARSALAPAGGAIPRVVPATADPRSNWRADARARRSSGCQTGPRSRNTFRT